LNPEQARAIVRAKTAAEFEARLRAIKQQLEGSEDPGRPRHGQAVNNDADAGIIKAWELINKKRIQRKQVKKARDTILEALDSFRRANMVQEPEHRDWSRLSQYDTALAVLRRIKKQRRDNQKVTQLLALLEQPEHRRDHLMLRVALRLLEIAGTFAESTVQTLTAYLKLTPDELRQMAARFNARPGLPAVGIDEKTQEVVFAKAALDRARALRTKSVREYIATHGDTSENRKLLAELFRVSPNTISRDIASEGKGRPQVSRDREAVEAAVRGRSARPAEVQQ
jgi:hypothetical protein